MIIVIQLPITYMVCVRGVCVNTHTRFHCITGYCRNEISNSVNVTVSGKTGLIAHLKVSRNVGFKYSVCCSWPMVVAMHIKFSHVSQQFLTFLIIH